MENYSTFIFFTKSGLYCSKEAFAEHVTIAIHPRVAKFFEVLEGSIFNSEVRRSDCKSSIPDLMNLKESRAT